MPLFLTRDHSVYLIAHFEPTETRTERDAWLEAIRNAKLSQAAALSTLASPSESAQETDASTRPGIILTRRPWSTLVTASEALTLRGQIAPPPCISNPAAGGSPAATVEGLYETKAHRVSPTRLDDADIKVVGSKRTIGRSTATRSTDGKPSVRQLQRHAYRDVQRLFVGGAGLHPPLSRAEHDPNVTDDASSGGRQIPKIDTYRQPVWTPDRSATRCASCRQPFGLWRRRHHCRLCGDIFCWQCASEVSNSLRLQNEKAPRRLLRLFIDSLHVRSTSRSPTSLHPCLRRQTKLARIMWRELAKDASHLSSTPQPKHILLVSSPLAERWRTQSWPSCRPLCACAIDGRIRAP